jgi:NADH:ubiquinone oxidoreductase subunit
MLLADLNSFANAWETGRFHAPLRGYAWTGVPRGGIKSGLIVDGPPAMKTFLLRLFTWWNGQTFGTQWWTWLYGGFVGEDEFGNRYFRTRGGKIDPTLGFERRWVIYRGLAEASTVPPSWHGWLHHTVDVPPTQESSRTYGWEKPHRPNLTGTPGAHRPSGSTLAQGRRPKATGDYKAWNPGG